MTLDNYHIMGITSKSKLVATEQNLQSLFNCFEIMNQSNEMLLLAWIHLSTKKLQITYSTK